MSDFTRGLLLGGGNLFGNPSPSGGGGGIDFAARNANEALREEIRHLKADIASKDAVSSALRHCLREVDPNHPLIDPYEIGKNPLRERIGQQAYDKALDEMDQNPNF